MPDDPQPEATTTAARVLSDSEITEIRQDHSNTHPECPECLLLATLDAATAEREQAEREVDKIEAIRQRTIDYWKRDSVAKDTILTALGEDIQELQSRLADERQARERAEAERTQMIDVATSYGRHAKLAEAALATERGRGERLVKDVSAISNHPSAGEWVADKLEWALDRWREAASSQAAPHEPPQGDG